MRFRGIVDSQCPALGSFSPPALLPRTAKSASTPAFSPVQVTVPSSSWSPTVGTGEPSPFSSKPSASWCLLYLFCLELSSIPTSTAEVQALSIFPSPEGSFLRSYPIQPAAKASLYSADLIVSFLSLKSFRQRLSDHKHSFQTSVTLTHRKKFILRCT